MRTPRLVAILLGLAIGAGGALGATATSSGADAGRPAAAKHHPVVNHRAGAEPAKNAKKAETCTRRQRAQSRRCRVSYRMSAKRLRPLRGPTSTASPGAGTPAATPATPPATTPGTPATPPSALPPPVLSTVGANAYDMGGFVLRLTKTTIPAGNLTVFFTNHDVSEHNLWIESPGGGLERISDEIGLNASVNKTVAVTAGTWRLFCSLPEHEAMTRDLNVTP